MRIVSFVAALLLLIAVGDSEASGFKWLGQEEAVGAKKADDLFRQARSAYGSADYSKTIELTSQALKADKKHAKSYALRGKAKKDMGDVDGAIRDLNLAVALDKSLGEAYFIRGQVREIMGEMDRAAADYKLGCAAGFRDACR